MNSFRSVVAVAALLLLGGLTPARCADQVVVAGDPPLTQANVDLFQQMWEWYCDIRLTGPEHDQLGKAFTSLWRKRTKAGNLQALDRHHALEKEWRALLEMDGEDRERQRARTRDTWINSMRQAKDDVCLVLLPIYDDAYKPGGTNNPIVVAGDPPLTQGMLDVELASAELLLDLHFTNAQRQEYQRLLTGAWKSWGQEQRQRRARNLEAWAALPTWTNYKRNEVRTLSLRKALEPWGDEPVERTRWLLALQEAASRPGSPRNPVLVDGKPPLTQLQVDRYTDYLEIMLDLSVSGGFTAPQRQVLQDYLVKGWNKRSADDRKELLTDLERWTEAAGKSGIEAAKCITALRPKLLAQLSTAGDDPCSLWLLGVFDRERQEYQQRLALEKRRHEAALDDIRAIPTGPTGHWEYNSRTGRYDRWVSD